MTIISYFLSILTFLITFSAAIAIGLLIISGIRYLSSAGKPEEIKKARENIISIFLGIIVLVSSYLILNSINPQLVKISLPALKEISTTPLEYPPPTKISSGDLLLRIKELSEKVKDVSKEIKEMAEDIEFFTDNCECIYTKAVSLCTGGDDSSRCKPYQCYAGASGENDDLCGSTITRGNHPCPDIDTIKQLQKLIIDWKDVLLYYKNRALAEWKDLENDLNNYLNIKIEHYESLLKKELGKKRPNKSTINFLNELIEDLKKEKKYKEDIMDKLADLSSLIIKIENPINEISKLPDQCFYNVAEKCEPTSKSGQDYGCHDKLCGCPPGECKPIDPDNPNPCPDKEIEKQLEKIKELEPQIIKISDEIINIINNIQ